VITGGINHHFPEYEKHFREILDKYHFAGCYKGPVTEKEIFTLFTNSDLLLLPYNSPGGHSAVLEQALFFEVPTIAIDFPEYREQSKGVEFVRFANNEQEFLDCVKSALLEFKQHGETIQVKEKIKYSVNNIKHIIEQS
jgi:hypothetical protein